ncbi:urea carboxylase-associated family protein [Hoeflea sp. G2-23]|uniref:Urea carboxylase-associated family protein n=1 Tax=Hoeflea algicola TaxID=2983763 RepID=A0ABT3ZEI2_9HYPH|nr:urea carboxylase-associated family protein [Hoeflea algicola]MCY0150202.1 urea carboxylase-associated family protein [Hoeflea algicola]
MKPDPITEIPEDAAARKAVKPVVCYPIEMLPRPDLAAYRALRDNMELIEAIVIPPRDAATWVVPAGHFCRLVCSDGPQVGDLNLHNLHNINERFYSGKTRELNGTHVGLGDQLFSNFPYMRPIATITLGNMSACPGGDCSSKHSSDEVACYPLLAEVYKPTAHPDGWQEPMPNGYDRSHGA